MLDLPIHEDPNSIKVPFLSSNRILLVLPLSNETKENPKFETKFENLKSVFRHYEPSCSIELKNEQQEAKIENLVFDNLLHFYPEYIIENNATLQTIESGALLQKNISKILEKTKKLERSYRYLSSFFKNVEDTSITANLTLLDADLANSSDTDYTLCKRLIERELFNKVYGDDLKNHYSILLIPGFISNPTRLNELAKMAYEHKIILLTDYKAADSFQEIIQSFDSATFDAHAIPYSHVVMTCNWIKSRDKYVQYGEKSDFFIPASGALAAKIGKNPIYQVSAGEKYGTLNEVEETELNLKRLEIEELGTLGFVPIVKLRGKVMAYSEKTLFQGESLGSTVYPLIRFFDWAQKCLMEYLNRKIGNQALTPELLQDLERDIETFLSDCTKYHGLQSYGRVQLEVSQENSKELNILAEIKPFFPNKNFILSLAADFS